MAFSLVGAASAQEIDVQAGKDLFATYCWQCHGSNAKGLGPMAEMLAIAPPDPSEAKVELDRGHRRTDGSVHPARRACLH